MYVRHLTVKVVAAVTDNPKNFSDLLQKVSLAQIKSNKCISDSQGRLFSVQASGR